MSAIATIGDLKSAIADAPNVSRATITVYDEDGENPVTFSIAEVRLEDGTVSLLAGNRE